VLLKIQPFIGCVIPVSTTPQNFSTIRPSELQDESEECANFRIYFLRKNESDPSSYFFMNGILDILFKGNSYLGYYVLFSNMCHNF
jgi:hypothetical protein